MSGVNEERIDKNKVKMKTMETRNKGPGKIDRPKNWFQIKPLRKQS